MYIKNLVTPSFLIFRTTRPFAVAGNNIHQVYLSTHHTVCSFSINVMEYVYLSLSVYQGWNYVYGMNLLNQDWGNMSGVPFLCWYCGSFRGCVGDSSTQRTEHYSVISTSVPWATQDWVLAYQDLPYLTSSLILTLCLQPIPLTVSQPPEYISDP